MTLSGNKQSERKRNPNKAQALHCWNSLLAAYEQEFPVSGPYVEFLSDQKLYLLNGFLYIYTFKSDACEKAYCIVDAVFLLLAIFWNRSGGCSDSPVLVPTHILYSDIVNALIFETCVLNAHSELRSYVQKKNLRFKT